MGQVLQWTASSPSSSLSSIKNSGLPSSQQAKLSELTARFLRVAQNHPEKVANMLYLGERLLQMFDA
jgi:hypothetical protein